MKLAEALSIRKDLQKRIEQLKSRLENTVKVQEGEQPAENPEDLLKELDGCLNQLETMLYRINATNMQTVADGKTLTMLLAEREVLTMRTQTLRSVFERASASQERYSRSEIKMVTTVDVKKLRAQVDRLSSELRQKDVYIQSLNFTTDLVEG
jgi:hypothetical protein